MTLFVTIFRRRLIEMSRYPLELTGGLVIFYLFFLMMFLGARMFGGPEIKGGDTMSAVAVGFIVFVVAQQSYQSIGQQLLLESTQGTLEQLAMSPAGLRRVLLLDCFAQALTTVTPFGLIVFPIMVTTGRWLHLDPLSVVPLVVVTLAGVVGVGLALGGVTIVAKRAQAVFQVVGFAFLPLVAAPVDERPLLKLLPVAHGSSLLREVMVQGHPLRELGGGDLTVFVAVNCGWVLLGVVVFARLERVARDRALLGQY